MLSDISIKNLYEYSGKGTVKFGGDQQIMNVQFDLFLLYNGRITGQLQFNKPYISLLGYLKELRQFTLDGVITDSGKKLIAEGCVLGSYRDSHSAPESRFTAHNVLLLNLWTRSQPENF